MKKIMIFVPLLILTVVVSGCIQGNVIADNKENVNNTCKDVVVTKSREVCENVTKDLSQPVCEKKDYRFEVAKYECEIGIGKDRIKLTIRNLEEIKGDFAIESIFHTTFNQSFTYKKTVEITGTKDPGQHAVTFYENYMISDPKYQLESCEYKIYPPKIDSCSNVPKNVISTECRTENYNVTEKVCQ